jgi:hypothetical protein
VKTRRFDFPTRAKKPSSRPWDDDAADEDPVPVPTLVEDTWPSAHLVAGFKPWVPWQLQPASEKQLAVLRKRGWTPPENLTKGQAWAAIGRATMKQVNVLKMHRQFEPGVSFEQAAALISAIAQEEEWDQ